MKIVVQSLFDTKSLVFTFMLTSSLILFILFNPWSNLPFDSHPVTLANPSGKTLADMVMINRRIEQRGTLIALSEEDAVTTLIFSLANAAGAKPFDLTKDLASVSYRDPNQYIQNLSWDWRFQETHDQDNLLEDGELAQLTISLAGILPTSLTADTPFVLELKPQRGAILSIARTIPSELPSIIDLN